MFQSHDAISPLQTLIRSQHASNLASTSASTRSMAMLAADVSRYSRIPFVARSASSSAPTMHHPVKSTIKAAAPRQSSMCEMIHQHPWGYMGRVMQVLYFEQKPATTKNKSIGLSLVVSNSLNKCLDAWQSECGVADKSMASRDVEAVLYLALTLLTQPRGFGTSTAVRLSACSDD